MKCDKCYKGIIRQTKDGKGVKCAWCNGTGELESDKEVAENIINNALRMAKEK